MQYAYDLKENYKHGDSSFPLNCYEASYTNIHLHWHDEMEFIYIQSGSGTFYIDFKPIEFKAGDIIVIQPGSIHSAKMTDNMLSNFQTIVFNLNFVNSYSLDAIQFSYLTPIKTQKYILPNLFSPNHEAYEALFPLIQELVTLIRYREESYELLVKSTFYRIFYNLLKYKQEATSTKSTTRKDQQNINKIKAVLMYVEAHYSETISIEQIANVIEMSPNYFCQFFKKQTGTTFFNYLITFRVEKAAHLLKHSGDSILDISYQVGFQDLSYFIRTFKKQTGYAPLTYRKLAEEA